MKVVLAAAMWNCPHLLVLDEPTNYLDRDSLGALAEGIKSFDGGGIMISHNSGAHASWESLCCACVAGKTLGQNQTVFDFVERTKRAAGYARVRGC